MAGRSSVVQAPPTRMTHPKSATGQTFAVVSRWAPLLLVLLSLALKSLIFAPIGWWPLAYVCLVPWLVAVRAAGRTRWMYFVSYLFGLSFYLINMYWLYLVTGPGYAALSMYMGAYFPLMAWLIRRMSVRRNLPLGLSVPVVWVASELLRATIMTGFPWFFLAHSHWRVLTMIQVSDLAGAYALSFVIAMANGTVADLLIARLGIRRARAGVRGLPRWALVGSLATIALLVCVAIYGRVRLRSPALLPGPTVAVLQGDYVAHVAPPPGSPGPRRKRATYRRLLTEVDQLVDLYVIPETPWSMYLNKEFRRSEQDKEGWVRWSKSCHEWLAEAARQKRAHIVVGSLSVVPQPEGACPSDYKYNSAFMYDPSGAQIWRYDKVHLVLFGEYVPFRYGRLHGLYERLNRMTPWGAGGYEYSLTPGKEFSLFEMKAASKEARVFRFGVPICYEDVMPYVCRRFAVGPDGSKRADFLLNISNDGWFHHSSELPQHFAICVFRAVENRVAIARAVNTGMSGLIDSTGRHRELGVGRTGHLVGQIQVDPRVSLYSRWGDWFAVTCCLLAGLILIDALVGRLVGLVAARKDRAEKK